MAERTRYPRRVYESGEEPDARFSLANERTFLAWTRTALALIAGGVALEVLGLDLNTGLRLAASLLLIVGGIIIPFVAWADWMHTERALRRGEPMPHSMLGTVLASLVTVIGVLVLLAIVMR